MNANNEMCSHLSYEVGGDIGAEGKPNAFCVHTNSNLYVSINASASRDEMKAYMAEQYAAGTPVTVAWRLAEPVAHQLTSRQLNGLNGEMYVWASAGQVEMVYRQAEA